MMKKLLTFFLTALLAFSVGWAETVTDFQETFNDCAGTGGNDGSWSGSIASSNLVTDNTGWTTTQCNGASACLKGGSGKNAGSATTPSISVTSGTSYTLTFRAGAWNGSSEKTILYLSATGGTLSSSSVTMTKGAWTSYTITFTANGTSAKITFEGNGGNSRFFLDDVVLTHEGGGSPSLTTATVSFPDDSYTATLGQGFTAPTLTVTPAAAFSEVSYTSSDANVATVNPTTGAVTLVGAGTTTITAAITGSSTYTDASDSYELTVSSGSTPSDYDVIDFTDNNHWTPNLPTTSTSSLGSYNDGTYTVTLAGTGYYSTSGKYLLIGKANASITFPAFGRDVEKIVVEGNSGASSSTVMNIYVGDNAVSTATTGSQGTNTYLINEDYQEAGTIYTLKITSSHNAQIKHITIYFKESSTPKVKTPTFSVAEGTYTSAQVVEISCATSGATIYYTTDGSTPTTSSTPYSGAITVDHDMTIKAIAVATGYDDSDVATATYTINLAPTLTVSPTIVNINDDHSANGRKGSFTVTGTNIGTDNVGVTRTNDKFTPALSATTGTTYAGEYNGTPYWGFTPAGSLEGKVDMTYNGHALSATTAVTLANAEGANHVSAVVNVNYLYTGPIYIMGNVNETGWAANNGEPMVRDESTGNYSKTLSLLDSGDGHAYISFTKALANGADDWNSIAGDRFGPESNGNWTFNENLVNEPCALDTLGGYWSIKVPTGEWVVSIDPNTNTFTLVPHVPAPVFDPAGGRYETAQDVEITCTNVDAHIYYTTDGSTPSANNGSLYTGPITVSAESTTIKAIAIYGNASSTVTTATYTIKPIGADDFILVESDNDITAGDEYVLVYTSTTGVHHAMSTTFGNNFYEETTDTDEDFTLADGVVTLLQDPSNVNVLTLEEAGDYFYIKDHDSNYLYYTGSNNNVYRSATNAETDGYKWQMTINSDGDVVIRNVGTSGSSTRYLQSNPSSNRYACYKTSSNMFDPKLYKKGTSTVLAPQITPAGGTSNKRFESVEVTMTAAEGCTIYYTLDGSAPTVNSDVYDPTEGLTVPYGSAPTTVKAIAVDGEGKVSRVTTMVYYWDRVQVSISPASKEVVGNVDVTITPSPSDATVTYTINGGEPQTYNGQFTVQVNEENTPVTVEATAVKGESTATASVTYTYKDGGVNSIAEFLALDNNEERFFKNPVVVLFDYSQNGDQDYIWVKDRTGYMKLFIQPGFDESSSKPRYNNGDVIPEGFTVKKITYTEHDASFIEGKSEDPSLENFKNPTERALADPEQVKLSELLANPAYYNDRYLYINKLEITGQGGVNYYVASDENNDNTSEVSGNNVIIYNKFPTWKEKDGTSHTVTIPSADGTYYNVKFIFQKYGSVYEIMPIEFTPWEENKVRLEDLVKIEVSTPYKEYTISNDLIATKVTWDDNKGKFAIFAKDDEAYASPRHRLDGQESYFIRYENVNHPELNNTVMQEDYDQSNWVEILIPSAINSKLDGGYQSQLDEFKSQFENMILPGGSIHGTYIDKLNPTIEYNLSELPSNLAKSDYKPNIYTPVNFLMENLDDEGSEAGAKSYRTDALGNQYFFMMDAKPQEMGLVVWCYYPGNGDYFYITERIGDQVNGHQFRGSFKADMSLCEDPDVSTANGGGAIVNCFDPSNADGNGIDQVKLYGFNAIVRKNPAYNSGSSNGAPRRVDVAPYYEGTETNPAYIVYPLNAGAKSTGTVTSVAELASSRVVESVRYYNIMGMESEQPFEGINIVVTRYSDGSSSTAKVLR